MTIRSHPFCAWLCGALIVSVVGLALLAGEARAGQWMQISCVNPSGTPASSQGWSSFTTGSPSAGSDNNVNCSPGHQMYAILSNAAPAPAGAAEVLQYAPPQGSTVVGGQVGVNMAADGYGTNAIGQAVLLEPDYVGSNSNVFFRCAYAAAPCQGGTNVFMGAIDLPGGRGGNLYLQAGCAGSAGAVCNAGGSYRAWATVGVPDAHLLLSSMAAPQATTFSGSALQSRVHGTGHLVFTATDSGPGVYHVTAFIDGQVAEVIQPNTNDGECVPVGTDAGTGALMFDWAQPCPPTTVVDLPVPTSGLPDGSHELAVAVTDAAQNTSVVLDQRITSSNPQTTPVPRSHHSVRAELVISWRWFGTTTQLRSIAVHNLPRNGSVSISCRGRGCPRLRVLRAKRSQLGRLLRDLGGRHFRAGDRVRITLSAPLRRPERVELQIRDGRQPQARLLR